MIKMIKPFSRVALVLLSLLGCAELGALVALQQGMAREFHEYGISINISNASLTVSLANSAADSLPEVEKAAYARRVAEYVRDHFPKYSSLASIDVRFASVAKTGPVTYSQSSAGFHFTPADLGPPKRSTEHTVSS